MTLPLAPHHVRRLRAVLLAFVLTGSLVAALPRVKLKPEEMNDPELWKEEIAMWHGWLSPVGITTDQIRAVSVGAARFWFHFVKALRYPWEPMWKLTKTNQQWGMFASVTEAPERLVIEVRRNGEWEMVYRRLDPDYAWHEEELKYRRIRGIWDGVKEPPKGTYRRFTIWVARTAFEEDPAVDRVRVKLERTFLTFPWEEPDTRVTYRAEKYHRREKLMDEPDEEPAEPAPSTEEEYE